MKTVDYFTNVFSHYREPLWKLLIDSKEIRYNIFFSKKEYQGIKTSITHETSKLKPVLINFTFLGKIYWQSGVISSVLKSRADGIMFLGEMNLLSTWISVLICKLKKKKIFFWGHGVYGHESYLKLRLRTTFLKLADINFLYGHHAKNLLVKRGLKKNKIQVIYNSIPSTSKKAISNETVNQDFQKHKMMSSDLLFIGRLTKGKQIELLFKAFKKAKKINSKLRLFVIGEGKLKLELENKFSTILESVFFLGSIYNEKKLKYYISNSALFISPGNVGLACIHALSYGTPVCTHNNINYQMPEAEVLDKQNGIFFKRNDVDSLVNSILNGVKLKENPNTSNYCKKSVFINFTPENQYRLLTSKMKETL